MAKEAMCFLNEFGRMPFEDQGYFLDVMEEGKFTINKYGINAEIDSPTTIIASANPLNNSEWKDGEKIDLNEIPTIGPVFDRFDLVFILRNIRNEKVNREYAYKKSGFLDRKIPDYTIFLQKYIRYT
jgi:replicative DNA helicase Mcm